MIVMSLKNKKKELYYSFCAGVTEYNEIPPTLLIRLPFLALPFCCLSLANTFAHRSETTLYGL